MFGFAPFAWAWAPAGLLLLALAAPAWAGGTYGPVRPGETLWQIAGRAYPGARLDRDLVMLALQEANPDALTPACNLNGTLKVGARLRLPDPKDVGVGDRAAARLAVAGQARDWAEHRRTGRPLACPAPRAAEPSPAPVRTESMVRAAPTPAGGPAPIAAPACPEPATCPGPQAPSAQGADLVPEAAEEGPARRLAQGPSAPGWALVPLALVVAALGLGWGRRRATDPRPVQGQVPGPAESPSRLTQGAEAQGLLLVLAALVGVLGAAVTVVFREAIHAMERILGGDGEGLIGLAQGLAPWQRLLLPALGGLLAGLVLAQIGGRLRGRTTTDYMAAVATGDGWISVRHSLVKAGSSILTVASGGSIGREGAMVQLAAMVASALGRLARFPEGQLRLLVAAGAAAGLASAYNAPLAATLFVAELVLGSIALEHIGPLVIAAVVAGVTVHDILGYDPVYRIPEFQLASDWELGLYLILGLLAGHLAPLFLRLLGRSHRAFAGLPWPLAARLGMGGLIVGAISVYEPQVWGNGYGVVDSVLARPWAWQALLTVLVLKMLATAATHGSGAVGGAFTPTLFVGAMLGALFGTLVQTLVPAGTAPPSAYAVVGMGAMLAGATHAPLMSILMIFEMTLDYRIVLPLMLAVVAAHYTARRYAGVRPMYAESLLPRAEAPERGGAPARSAA